MDNSFLKKRKERNMPKISISPITMCKMFFKEGVVFNNSNTLGVKRQDTKVGIISEFKEFSDGSVQITFLNERTLDAETWTIYKNGEYAKIVEYNKLILKTKK